MRIKFRSKPQLYLVKSLPSISQADIIMHSYDSFFREGGEFNQPSWMTNNKVKNLRNFYAKISRLGTLGKSVADA
jgi:hypothetical protein